MSCVSQGSSSAGLAACSLCGRSLQQTAATQGQPRTFPGQPGEGKELLGSAWSKGQSGQYRASREDAQQLGFSQPEDPALRSV